MSEPTPVSGLPVGTQIGRFIVSARPVTKTTPESRRPEPPTVRPHTESTIPIFGRDVPTGLRHALEVRYRRQGRRILFGATLRLTDREYLMVRLYRALERELRASARTPQARAELMERGKRLLAAAEQSRANWMAMSDEERDLVTAERNRETARAHTARREGLKRDNGPSAPYTRAGIYERDSGTCAWCLGPVDLSHRKPDPRAAELDHIERLQDGGADHPDNIAIVHAFCNNSRNAGRLVIPPDFARYWLAQRVQRGPRKVSYSMLTQDHINLWEDARDWTRNETGDRPGAAPGQRTRSHRTTAARSNCGEA